MIEVLVRFPLVSKNYVETRFRNTKATRTQLSGTRNQGRIKSACEFRYAWYTWAVPV